MRSRALTALAGIQQVVWLAAPFLFQFIMICVQLEQPYHDPLAETMSTLVWGRLGWLQALNFAVFGAMVITVAVRIRGLAAGRRSSVVGNVLLFLIGVCFLLLAVCPNRMPGSAPTFRSYVHGTAVDLVAALFPLTCALLARSVRRGRMGTVVSNLTVAAASLELAMLVAGGFLVFVFPMAHLLGLLERAMMLVGCAWLELLAVYYVGNFWIRPRTQTSRPQMAGVPAEGEGSSSEG